VEGSYANEGQGEGIGGVYGLESSRLLSALKAKLKTENTNSRIKDTV
jgi:hypothetical protein